MSRDFKNDFSWSVSRDKVFRECPRKYYFNYYGYWGGWESDAPVRTREIYVLKQLLHRSMWVGQLVHDCIAHTLQNLSRNVPVLELDEILSITRNRMRQDFRESSKRKFWQNPKDFRGLFEHEYNVDVEDEQWRENAEEVDHCLKTFYASEHYEALRRLDASDFLEIERFSSFELEGEKVMMRLDCATREAAKIVVWDWKTGKGEGDIGGLSRQMACYAFYARHAFDVSLPNVITRRFDLYRGELHEHALGESELADQLGYIRGSIKDMKGLLTDVEENTTEEERFTKVEIPEICIRCNFLKTCKPNL